jgi:hypothetical protein
MATPWQLLIGKACRHNDDDSYCVGPADKVPRLNGTPITHPTKLESSDVIEVAGVELESVVRD